MMRTQNKTKEATIAQRQRDARKRNTQKKQAEPSAIKEDAVQETVPLDKIELSPLNYRKWYDPKALEDFAQEISVHGIISPVTIRPLPDSRFELVAGERRVRAARIAGLTTIPAAIKTLSDDEVREIQLAENMQRENPHPLHEAQAINDMLQIGKTIEEAALRLGKSKAFVYNRMKLATLIEPFQMVFIANKITIQDAFEIARLSPEVQQELYAEHFDGEWEDENFEADDLHLILRRYRYDLHHAPFDIKDKQLFPAMGACTRCPFNSATLKSLFPEMAKEAICSNRNCYDTKCKAHDTIQIENLIKDNIPDAIVTIYSNVPEVIKETVEKIAGSELPVYNQYNVDMIASPEIPAILDYTTTDGEKETFDETGYQLAMQEYEADMQEFQSELETGRIKTGLNVGYRELSFVYFNPEKKNAPPSGDKAVTAKEVQEAIKTGTATTDLLQAEIARLEAREQRSKELDAEKVQQKIYEQFALTCSDNDRHSDWTLTPSHITAIKLLVFQSLGYMDSQCAANILFADKLHKMKPDSLFEKIAAMGEQELCYLIRKVIAGKAESKNPRSILGYALYKMAESAGLDVVTIEQEQQEIAVAREGKLSLRIKDVESRIGQINDKAITVTAN